MLTADDATLRARAERLADGLGEVVESTAKVGGGALPLLELPGPVVAVAGDPRGARRPLRANAIRPWSGGSRTAASSSTRGRWPRTRSSWCARRCA